MNEQEWNELYQFLLTRLRELELLEVAGEVEYAATHRIIEHDANPSLLVQGPQGRSSRLRNQRRLLAVSSDEDDFTLSRAPNAQEAFAAALDVLRTRLIELPNVLQAAAQGLDRELSQVEWWPDVQPGEVAAEFEQFSGGDLVSIMGQLQIVQATFSNLDELVRSTRQ